MADNFYYKNGKVLGIRFKGAGNREQGTEEQSDVGAVSPPSRVRERMKTNESRFFQTKQTKLIQ